jgi:hypothetical protein
MSVSSTRIAGLLLGSMVALSAAAAPAAGAGLDVVAPTDPAWARWLGLDTGQQFVLSPGRHQFQIGNFPEPRRVRVCVADHTTPAFRNVGARIIADGTQIVVPVAHCNEITGKHIVAEPAAPLGGEKRVGGTYSFVG